MSFPPRFTTDACHISVMMSGFHAFVAVFLSVDNAARSVAFSFRRPRIYTSRKNFLIHVYITHHWHARYRIIIKIYMPTHPVNSNQVPNRQINSTTSTGRRRIDRNHPSEWKLLGLLRQLSHLLWSRCPWSRGGALVYTVLQSVERNGTKSLVWSRIIPLYSITFNHF